MYKSPIEKIYSAIHTQMMQEDENMVMKAITKIGVNVDKEELIKALQYDRNQYTEGYEDGKNDVLNKVRAEIEQNAYPIVHGCNNYEKGMTLYGIMQVFDKYKTDKVIKQLDRIDNMFVNANEIKSDDEIFNDDFSDPNIQNGWIYCKDRLPNINEWVLCHCQANIKEILRLTYDGWYKDNSHCYMESFVIAWQPLPKWEVEE